MQNYNTVLIFKNNDGEIKMDIIQGLTDHQVLQRNSRNLSETYLEGKCDASGVLCLRVTSTGSNKALPGLADKKITRLNKGRFKVKLTGIPVGGPYDVTLILRSSNGQTLAEYQAKDILVGDVWILGGQSNMQGIGYLKDAAKPDKNVRAFYMDDRWSVAQDPIHNLDRAVDPVHADLCGGTLPVRSKHAGVGPGVAFGQNMAKLTGVPQGLLACAHGGTTMAQWDPALKKLGGKSLYGATLRRFIKNGSNVAGVVWYQGCSDADSQNAPLYTSRMKKLVAAFRRDMGGRQLPFAMVQIAGVYRVVPDAEGASWWNSIQDQERLLPKVIKNLTVVPVIDLVLDDLIHISGRDQQRLGRRLAEATWTLIKGKNALKPPMALKSIRKLTNPYTRNLEIEVAFDHVEGSLQSPGKALGFALALSSNQLSEAIYRTDLKGNTALLRTAVPEDFDENELYLHYGWGYCPSCNITDQAGRSLPVFGPVSIAVDQKPMISMKKIRTSKILPGAGKLQDVICPDTADRKLGWQGRQFPTCFANLHNELMDKTNDALVFFAGKFKCDEAMKLKVGVGYDGPVKLWIDRKEVFYDPNGINPMIPDQAMIDFKAKAGEHEIVVAFSANFGKAWGIAIRLHRLDVTKRQLCKGTTGYKLPEILV
jgi:sialate O-acetylesterase